MIDIGKFNDVAKYDLVLYTPYEKAMQSLNNKILNFHYNGTYLGTDEITFDIPYYIYDSRKREDVKNPIYDLVKAEFLVLVKNLFYKEPEGKFFIVKTIDETSTEEGIKFKSVLMYTRENALTDKKIIDYQADSRLIYDVHNQLDNNGLERGFLNYIFNRTGWSAGDVSPSILSKYRAVSIQNNTMLGAIQEMGKTFDCVFSFDTINKKISVHDLNELGSNNDAFISDRNFITNIKKSINSAEVKTRLYLYGKDNVSIQRVNPTGQPYIDNFNFFKTTEYMTPSLIDALDEYDVFVESQDGMFREILDGMKGVNKAISERNETLFIFSVALKIAQDNYDLSLADPEQFPNAKNLLEEAKTEYAEAEQAVKEKENEYNALVQGMNNLRESMQAKNHFTEEQMAELDNFIKEDVYTNSDYESEQMDELYEYGKNNSAKISSPSINFEVDVIDFLTLLEYQSEWHKFNLGDLLRLKNDDLNINYLVRFVGYEHNVDDNALTLQFTNKDSLSDRSIYLVEILDRMNTSAASVDWNKYYWNQGKDAKSLISEYIDNNLDLAKQQIVTGKNQRVLMDEGGFWLTKEDELGRLAPEQIRMVNNVIAITKDNWETVEIALSPDTGINAKLINGEIGNFATLNASQLFGDLAQAVKVDAGQVTIGSEFSTSPIGKKVEETVDDKIGVPLDENKTIYQILMEKATELEEGIAGAMAIHRGAYVPTTSNEPTKTWIEEGVQSQHNGDVFIDTSSGEMYQFITDGTASEWSEITNQSVIDAIGQIKDEVNKVFLSRKVPTGNFMTGDLWIMPSGATFTYDDSKPSNYKWQLSSPTLVDLGERVLQEMRAEAISKGRITESSTSYSVYMSTSVGNGYMNINWNNMTGTWNGYEMPELWIAYLNGVKGLVENTGFQLRLAVSFTPSASSTYGGHYNTTTATYGIIQKSETGSYSWHHFNATVKHGVEYNKVVITPKDGIVVYNSDSTSKAIQLGITNNNNYGLSVYNATGTREIIQVGRKGSQQGVWVNNNSGANILKMGTSDNEYGFSVMDGSRERLRLGKFTDPVSSNTIRHGYLSNLPDGRKITLDEDGLGLYYPNTNERLDYLPFVQFVNFSYVHQVLGDSTDLPDMSVFLPNILRGRTVYFNLTVTSVYLEYHPDYLSANGWYNGNRAAAIDGEVRWKLDTEGYMTRDMYRSISVPSHASSIVLKPGTYGRGMLYIGLKGRFEFYILG